MSRLIRTRAEADNRGRALPRRLPTAPAEAERNGSVIDVFPDPNAPGTEKTVFIARFDFEDGIIDTAAGFTGPIVNALSLADVRKRSRNELSVDLHSGGTGAQITLGALHPRPRKRFAPSGRGAIAYLEMYEGRFAEAEQWLNRGMELSRTSRCARAQTAPTCGPCWESRRCDEESSTTVSHAWALELHLPDRARGRPPASRGLARGDQAFHGLPRGMAGRSADSLAPESRLHDPGRIPGQGAPRLPDPARSVPLEDRRGPAFTNVATLVGLTSQGADHRRRQHLRRLHGRRLARHLRNLARRGPWVRRSSSTAATGPSRTAPNRPAWIIRSMR